MGARLSRPLPRGDHAPLLRRIDKLGSILEVAKALAAERDLDALLQLVVEETARVAGADRCTLFLVDRERGTLYPKIAQGVREGEAIRVPLGVGIAGHVAKTGEVLNLADAYRDPRFNPAVDQATGYRTLSLLCVPLRHPDGAVIGVLQALNKKDGLAFDEEDEELVVALAGLGASAIANALHREEIETLFEGFVRASVVAIESRDGTTAGHSERVARLTLGLADAVERETSGPYKDLRFSPEQRQELRYAALLHDFGKVGVREEVLVKANKLHPWEFEALRQRFDYAKRSMEVESLRRQRDMLLLGAGREAIRREEELLAERLAEIDRAWELVSLCNRPTVLPVGGFGGLEALARIQYLGPDEREHSLLTTDEVELLTIRQGSLSPHERLEIQSHVSHTYRFLSRIPWTRALRRVPEIAYAHHEKLDGSGYPRGLSGSAIPVEARMMTIADIYDALTVSDRPYKRPIPHEIALSILEDEARQGKIDAELVRIFIEADVPRCIHER